MEISPHARCIATETWSGSGFAGEMEVWYRETYASFRCHCKKDRPECTSRFGIWARKDPFRESFRECIRSVRDSTRKTTTFPLPKASQRCERIWNRFASRSNAKTVPRSRSKSPKKVVLFPGAAVASITSKRSLGFVLAIRKKGGRQDALVWRITVEEVTSGLSWISSDAGIRRTQGMRVSRHTCSLP